MSEREAVAAEVMELFQELSHRLRRRGVERLSELGLSLPVAAALHHLDEPIAMGKVAERLSCDASYVTGLADRLEERGLAERRPDPNDRRIKQIVLTDEGRRIRREVEERMYEKSGFLSSLDEEELGTLASILEKIISSVE